MKYQKKKASAPNFQPAEAAAPSPLRTARQTVAQTGPGRPFSRLLNPQHPRTASAQQQQQQQAPHPAPWDARAIHLARLRGQLDRSLLQRQQQQQQQGTQRAELKRRRRPRGLAGKRPHNSTQRNGSGQRQRRGPARLRPVTPWNCPWAPLHSPARGAGSPADPLNTLFGANEDEHVEEGFPLDEMLGVEDPAEASANSAGSGMSGCTGLPTPKATPAHTCSQQARGSEEEEVSTRPAAAQQLPPPSREELEAQVAHLSARNESLEERLRVLELEASSQRAASPQPPHLRPPP